MKLADMAQADGGVHHESGEVPLLSLRNVGVSYPLRKGSLWRQERLWVLEDISFDLYRGDSLGVIGRNGVGKSTLLRLLAGAMGPCRGAIVRNARRAMLLTLKLGFLDYLTARENIILGGLFIGLTRKEIHERFDAIVEFSELEYALDRPFGAFSSGMKARLGMAVAFEANPDILLIDEVLGVGDKAFRKKAMAHMRKRILSKSNTVVFVSHNAGQVRKLCNRAVWIEDGVARAEGEVDEVIEAYETYLSNG